MKFSKALQIHELKVLESNFDPRPSKNPPSHLDGEAFRYLLDTIEPKVLLLHGQEVFDAAASIVPAHIRVVRAERHFSRISGEGLARAIAECVAAAS